MNEDRVCKLQKSIYGLRQASRNWYRKFTNVLVTNGFRQSKADYSMFIFKKGSTHLGALIYVDLLLLMGNDDKRRNEVKAY